MGIAAEDKFIPTSFGRLHYLEAGNGSPLFLLHSNGASAHEFEHVIPLLAGKFRVIAWDMPGQGDSDPLPKHLSVPDYADLVAEFASALGITSASVGGASIGGSICIAIAARHGALFPNVIAVETPCRPAEEWRTQWNVTERMFGFASQTAEQIKPRLQHIDDNVMLRWNIDRNKAGPKTMMSVMWALRDYDVIADMPRATARVTAIFGSKSALRSRAQIFADSIPGCRLGVAEGCGHFPMLDDPTGFADLIASALAPA